MPLRIALIIPINMGVSAHFPTTIRPIAGRSSWIPGSYVTSNSMSAGSNALPRVRTLCTNSKNPGTVGVARVRCPDAGAANCATVTSYSRWRDRSLHLCFKTPRARFPRTRLLSHMPVVTSTLPVAHPTRWACDLRFDAFPSQGIAPSRRSVGLALLQRSSLRSLAYDRPHVSFSEALLSAFASCGIPLDTPCGWYLLPWREERTYRVTPFPVSMVRIRRTVLSTGFLWQCIPVSGCGCRRPLLCPFGSSASASCAG